MDFVQNNWILIVAMIVSGTMLVYPALRDLTLRVPSIGTHGVTRLMNAGQVVLLDLREAKEMATGRLPRSVHIPHSELSRRHAELAKHQSKPIVVYCDAGNRSRGGAAMLKRAGFQEVYHLSGGFRAWKDAGLPVEA